LERYTITPSTYIVDLALRKDGRVIQSLLEAFTSRRTVPNILLNWQPVGGADELTLADAEGILIREFAQGGLRMSFT
jgi:glutaredoxin